MKKALVIAGMLFVSASVLGIENLTQDNSANGTTKVTLSELNRASDTRSLSQTETINEDVYVAKKPGRIAKLVKKVSQFFSKENKASESDLSKNDEDDIVVLDIEDVSNDIYNDVAKKMSLIEALKNTSKIMKKLTMRMIS